MRNKQTVAAAMTVFLLFFGFSLLDALKYGNWLAAIFWLAMGVLFMGLGFRGSSSRLR